MLFSSTKKKKKKEIPEEYFCLIREIDMNK